MITIYSKDNCQSCRMTKLHLTNLGISYTERNTDTNVDYLAEAKATGYTSMPIVVLDGKVIASGFQPDRLNELEKLSKGDFMNLEVDDVCEWSRESDDVWRSDCGLLWEFDNEETPKANNMNYCPQCGKILEEAPEYWEEAK